MTAWRPLSKKEFFVFAISSAIVMVVLSAAFIPYGRLRTTYDSQDLIEASRSLETYLTSKNKDGHSYLVRAPLHPLLLSFFQKKMLAMWWLNVLSLAASLFLIYKICRAKEFSPLPTIAAIAGTSMFYPWLMNFQFFWTEPVFIVLVLTLSYALLKNWSPFGIVIICVLLFFTRKAGIFFFAASAVVYCYDRKWRKALLLFAVGIILFATWQWFEIAHRSTGHFGVMFQTPDEYSRIPYLEALTSWFVPIPIPLLFRTVLVVLILIAAFYFFRTELFVQFQQRQNVVLLLVAGVYTFIFIVFTGASGYEDAERYLNVVFPCWLIVAISVVAKSVTSRSENRRVFIVVAVSLWLSYTFLRTVHHLV